MEIKCKPYCESCCSFDPEVTTMYSSDKGVFYKVVRCVHLNTCERVEEETRLKIHDDLIAKIKSNDFLTAGQATRLIVEVEKVTHMFAPENEEAHKVLISLGELYADTMKDTRDRMTFGSDCDDA